MNKHTKKNERPIGTMITTKNAHATPIPKHCGFEVEPPFPVKPLPIGTTFKANADGTVTPIYPDN